MLSMLERCLFQILTQRYKKGYTNSKNNFQSGFLRNINMNKKECYLQTTKFLFFLT